MAIRAVICSVIASSDAFVTAVRSVEVHALPTVSFPAGLLNITTLTHLDATLETKTQRTLRLESDSALQIGLGRISVPSVSSTQPAPLHCQSARQQCRSIT